MGGAVEIAVPHLLPLLADPDYMLRQRTVEACAKIDGTNEDVVDAIRNQIAIDDHPLFRQYGERALEALAAGNPIPSPFKD
jgi:hypothetical protein